MKKPQELFNKVKSMFKGNKPQVTKKTRKEK